MPGFRIRLSAALSVLRRPSTGFAALPSPDAPICIIGDLHGRLDLLEQMLAQIGRQADAGRARIVFVGDLIDRGPDSAGVLRLVRELTEERPEHVICLMGNHERMLLDFMDAPRQGGARWIANGGEETLVSYGLNPWMPNAAEGAEDRLSALASSLQQALPEGMENWLRQLPLLWQEGGLAISHAGADPARPMANQTADTLLWGHRAFLRQKRADQIWVAHGHIIVDSVAAKDGRIAVDTGAWRSGRLSAAWLDHNGLSVFESRKTL